MPQAHGSGNNPGKQLRGGEFYSPVRARVRSNDVLLSELRQAGARAVPRHEHELAYVTLVLQGDYLEGDRGPLDELQPFTAVFNPAGVAHNTVIGPAGAAFFTIEFREEAVHELGMRLPRATTFDRGAGTMLWPGLRLYSEFKAQTAAPIECGVEDGTLESNILEVLGAVCGFSAPEKAAPRWFRRTKERLHDGFRNPVRMRDLARDAGVHPVHLARVFRALERQTPGEYQRHLQVRAACGLLQRADWPLAAIAAECGFSDQSHFSRIFRRIAGTTPAKFRQTSGA